MRTRIALLAGILLLSLSVKAHAWEVESTLLTGPMRLSANESAECTLTNRSNNSMWATVQVTMQITPYSYETVEQTFHLQSDETITIVADHDDPDPRYSWCELSLSLPASKASAALCVLDADNTCQGTALNAS